jgi:hypothetical protein
LFRASDSEMPLNELTIDYVEGDFVVRQ